MKKGKVEMYINEILETKGAMLFSLIDPVDYKDQEEAIKTGIKVAEGGADILLLGGSTGVEGEILNNTAKTIKDSIDIPLVIFPGNITTVTKYSDAVYFMSLLNARNPYWITQAQMLAAPVVKKLGVEPLPVGYIVVHPGGTVGWIGDANLIPREKPKIAASLALAGEYLGNRLIVLDTGSNPKLQNSGPVPAEMLSIVKKYIEVPLVAAGGISNINDLKTAYSSGADIAQVGTAFEDTEDAFKKAQLFAKVVKEEGAKKIKR